MMSRGNVEVFQRDISGRFIEVVVVVWFSSTVLAMLRKEVGDEIIASLLGSNCGPESDRKINPSRPCDAYTRQ